MNKDFLLKIISFGLEGNAASVSSTVDTLINNLIDSGNVEEANEISKVARKVRTTSPFMKGWWNCFATATEVLLAGDNSSDETCINILKEADIKAKEAEDWLHDSNNTANFQKTAKIVQLYLYWLRLYNNIQPEILTSTKEG